MPDEIKPVVIKAEMVWVDKYGTRYTVCKKKHGEHTTLKCHFWHGRIPADAVWHGEVLNKQKFRRDLREVVVAFRREFQEWEKQLVRYNKKTKRVLTAFTLFHQKTIAEHLAMKPVFRFSYSEDINEAKDLRKP